jgi:hypothetical protein
VVDDVNVTETVTVAVCVKIAVTDSLPLIVTEAGFVFPLNPPAQPEKTQPKAGAAVKTTESP